VIQGIHNQIWACGVKHSGGHSRFLIGVKGRGQKTEDRGQRTEDRGQRTEDRRQRTEDRRQKIDIE